ncbi:ANTAR domain-containing protein [Nocardia jejuensis]|uniref:ANTAR domain-containing protein n=1 Tax=Nocardia jejuensis TaxID=328049 RepID=UPI00082A935F|nr:GAF and ANTAR domain-containing protein [Nocardia jejuensis]
MAHDKAVLVRALARFARLLPTPYKVETALDELVTSATEVFDLAGAGVSLLEGERLRFVSATSEPVITLERVQELEQQGPCMDASTSGELVSAPDLSTDRRWPHYRQTAARVGIQAVAGIPMSLNGDKVGAVNLYSALPRPWTDDDLEAALVLADMATGYLVNANTLLQHQQVTEQLNRALESRTIIEQAKGIISSVREISPAEAFELIRKYARANQAPLHAVAHAIVEAGLRI